MTFLLPRFRLIASCLLLIVLPGFGLADSKDQYTLQNTWEKARERLQLLESYSNPYTFDQLDKLGIVKGWYCLDAGAGYGGVTRWLADKVGVDGQVDALDMELKFLKEIDLPNVQLLEKNLVEDALPTEKYDLVFARDVLMHIPEREAVIQKLAATLKPGGILMIEDLGMIPGRYKNFSDNPDVNEQADKLYSMLTDGGKMSFLSAYDNPRRFTETGLSNVQASSFMPYQSGSSFEGKMLNLSMVQIKPLMLKMGANEANYEQARQQYLESSARWWGLSRVTTTGIKPL